MGNSRKQTVAIKRHIEELDTHALWKLFSAEILLCPQCKENFTYVVLMFEVMYDNSCSKLMDKSNQCLCLFLTDLWEGRNKCC